MSKFNLKHQDDHPYRHREHRPLPIVDHQSNRVRADLTHFWAITVLSNPQRFERRFELYYPFEFMCIGAGIKLITVELALGHRNFMVTDPENPYHVQVRSIEELWHKENLMNIGVRRATEIDPMIREVAFIDADVRPMMAPRDWFQETWHQLQHFQAVQMFEWFMDLDTESNPISGPRPSFMGSYLKGLKGLPKGGLDETDAKYESGAKWWLGPPGGAWAWNIEALNYVGGLMDFCILGSADWHMAQGLLGILEPMREEQWNPGYARRLFEWQTRALNWIKKDVGFVPGGLLHDNHGPKKYRYYVNRKKILIEHEYDPTIDIKYDHQGVLQLETWGDRQIHLRDKIRQYFAARNEDCPEFRE